MAIANEWTLELERREALTQKLEEMIEQKRKLLEENPKANIPEELETQIREIREESDNIIQKNKPLEQQIEEGIAKMEKLRNGNQKRRAASLQEY